MPKGEGILDARSVQLGDFLYLCDTKELKDKSGKVVYLRAQSALLLDILARQPNTLHGKDSLIAAIWPYPHVSDDSLGQCVSDIRRALKDMRRSILQTQPKRGYKLVPTQIKATGSTPLALRQHRQTPAAPSPLDASASADKSPFEVLAGRVEPHPTIAVLPLQPRLVSEDQVIVGDIIVDDIISALSRSDETNVISRLSTLGFRGKDATLSEIGAALNADLVLWGSFVIDAGLVRLQLEMADVQSNHATWSNHYDVSLSELINDLGTAHHIVSDIRKAISKNEIKRVRSRPLASLRNYSLLHAATGLMHRLSPADFNRAYVLLNELAERIPDHPAPLALKAWWHVMRVQQGWSDAPEAEAEQAMRSSDKALQIDPENTQALTSEGFVLTNLMHQLDRAEERYDAALSSNPNDAYANALRGTMFAFQGDGASAVRDCDRALQLSPLDPQRYFLLAMAAGAHLADHDFERALDLANQSLRFKRTHTSTIRIKIIAEMRLGRFRDARASVGDLMKLQPGLRVSRWLKVSPSGRYPVGRDFARALLDAGIPK